MTMTEHETNRDEYNGWPNRETWAASLHLSNDFGLYEMVNGWANDARREAIEESGADEFGFFAQGLVTVESTTILRLVGKLSDYVDDLRANIQSATDDASEMPTDTEVMMVLEIGSDWRVDWRAVASAWLEGFEFDSESGLDTFGDIGGSLDDECNTCGDSGRWETTTEDSPTELVDLGPCPDCDRGER